jgi:hypothetical protein
MKLVSAILLFVCVVSMAETSRDAVKKETGLATDTQKAVQKESGVAK